MKEVKLPWIFITWANISFVDEVIDDGYHLRGVRFSRKENQIPIL